MNQLLNCKYKLEDIKHNARALLCIRPMRQERVKWRNSSFFNVKKNLIKEEQEIQIIRNDHRLTAQKEAKIKQNQPPLPPNLVPCLEKKQHKRASTKSNISSSNLPHNHKRVTTNGCGISPQAQDTDMARAESNYLWERPGGYFFYSLHFFGDLQGLSHQLIAMELNHMATGPDPSPIFHFLNFHT